MKTWFNQTTQVELPPTKNWKADVLSISPYSEWIDEELTLETWAFQIFQGDISTFINLLDKTKINFIFLNTIIIYLKTSFCTMKYLKVCIKSISKENYWNNIIIIDVKKRTHTHTKKNTNSYLNLLFVLFLPYVHTSHNERWYFLARYFRYVHKFQNWQTSQLRHLLK